jgi:hypothetical protein
MGIKRGAIGNTIGNLMGTHWELEEPGAELNCKFHEVKKNINSSRMKFLSNGKKKREL